MELKLKEAYDLVLDHLEQATPCEDADYSIGCYGCGIRLVYKTLVSFREVEEGLA